MLHKLPKLHLIPVLQSTNVLCLVSFHLFHSFADSNTQAEITYRHQLSGLHLYETGLLRLKAIRAIPISFTTQIITFPTEPELAPIATQRLMAAPAGQSAVSVIPMSLRSSIPSTLMTSVASSILAPSTHPTNASEPASLLKGDTPHPEKNLATPLAVVCGLFMSFTVITIVLRLWVRLKIVRNPGADDGQSTIPSPFGLNAKSASAHDLGSDSYSRLERSQFLW